MSVIDTAFEKLDVDEANSDSDDDTGTPYKTDPILEPKVTHYIPTEMLKDGIKSWKKKPNYPSVVNSGGDYF